MFIMKKINQNYENLLIIDEVYACILQGMKYVININR